MLLPELDADSPKWFVAWGRRANDQQTGPHPEKMPERLGDAIPIPPESDAMVNVLTANAESDSTRRSAAGRRPPV